MLLNYLIFLQSLVGQLFLGFNCEANFNIIATLMFDRDQKKINSNYLIVLFVEI